MSDIATAASPDGDDRERDLFSSVEKIIEDANIDIALENLFTLMYKVGAYLMQWRIMMVGTQDAPGYNDEWINETAMILFERYFQAPESDGGGMVHLIGVAE